MSNTVLGYRNYWFEGFSTPDNTATPQLSDVAVYTATGVAGGYATTTFSRNFNPQLRLTDGAFAPSITHVDWVRVLGALNIQLASMNGWMAYDAYLPVEVRFVGTDTFTPGGTTLFDSGWLSVPSAIAPSDLLILPSVWYIRDAPVDGLGSVEISIRCPANIGDIATFHVGAFWCGPAFVTVDGLQAGWSTRVIDPGEMGISKGQQGFPQVGTRRRELSAAWAPVEFSVAYGPRPSQWSMIEVQEFIGKTGICVMFPRTQDSTGSASAWVQRHLGIYGHFAELGQITDQGGNMFTWGPFTFTELL